MLGAGQVAPDATLWLAPSEPATLRALAATGPILLVFYLFDWSST
jgi:peroxiredoxin